MISSDTYRRRKLVLLGFLLQVMCLAPVRSVQFDMLDASSSLNVTDSLLSYPSEHFELGIFPYGEDENYYLCIRYNLPVPAQVVTFVANRDHPVSRSAVLRFLDGELQLYDQTDNNNQTPWTASSGINAVNASLSDAGNLLLRDANGTVIWDSFKDDIPTDTLLPGQYMYRNRGHYLKSWQKNGSPPTIGNESYTFGWNEKIPTLSLSWTPPDFIKWTGGPYIPAPDVHNARKIEGVDYVYFHATLGHLYINSVPADTSILSGGSDYVNATTLKRITLSDDGGFRIFQWTIGQNSTTWTPKANWMLAERPDTRSQCTAYGTCGPFGWCISPVDSLLPVQCKCLDGFNAINDTDLAQGCIIPSSMPLITATMNCTDTSNINANFTTNTTILDLLTLEGTDMPWGGDYLILTGEASANCKEACRHNCWCSGAVYSEDEQKCWMKTGNLYNIGYPTLDLHGTKRTAYIRPVAVPVYPFPLPSKNKPWAKIIGLVVAGGAVVAVIVGSIWYLHSRGLIREAYQCCCGLCRARPAPPRTHQSEYTGTSDSSRDS